jgi:hypothetical protein
MNSKHILGCGIAGRSHKSIWDGLGGVFGGQERYKQSFRDKKRLGQKVSIQ